MKSLICLSALVFGMIPGARGTEAKPVLLYSRYFNAPGENRYSPDGNYQEVLRRLGERFLVRVNDAPLTQENLKDVSVVLVANPSDQAAGNNAPPHHVDANDIAEITAFVDKGGGFVVMGNQENHNLETTDMNKLLEHFGIQFTNVYTDAKLLKLPAETLVIRGLRWAYYTGNQLTLDPANAAQPVALVTNDLTQKPAQGNRDAAGVLMASATPGKGRVLVVTDSGWICDWAFSEQGVGGVSLKGQDNWEIFRRLMLWTSGADSKSAAPQKGPRMVEVTFNVTVPQATATNGRAVNIAGNLQLLAGDLPEWNPGGTPLTRVDPTHWTITVRGEEGTQIEYKYALGSWEFVEKDGNCGELGNRQLKLTWRAGGPQVINDTVANWRNVTPCRD